MAKAIIGNASAITVPRKDRDTIRRFYCDVLGGKIVKEDNEKDIFRLEEDFYIVHRYEDVPMRANSCGLQERSGCKSSPTTWKK